jgi:sugar phosphate isomerase/epimerase
MGRLFVNLPLRYLAENKWYLDFFIEHNLNPELGLDAIALDELDESWHSEIANILHHEDRPCAIHLPFHDLQPGSIDNLILEATRQRLKRSIRIAVLYQPRYLVAHDYFIPLYSDLFSKWLNRAVITWRQVMEEMLPYHIPLYLENVREKDPRPISDLLYELSDQRIKFCFDLGHWFSYGSGSQYQNLSFWLQTLAPFLAHLHLHDNDGIADQHLGLGQGNIPWSELFLDLDLLNLKPTCTLEQHTKEDLDFSWLFMKKHLEWFSRLGIRKQDFHKNI